MLKHIASRRQFLLQAGIVPIIAGGWVCRAGKGGIAFAGNRDHETEIVNRIRSERSRGNDFLRVFYPKGCVGNLEAFVPRFVELTGVRIQLVEASLDEIAAQLTLEHRMSTGEPYDVALPPTFALPDLATTGVISPLNSLAKEFEPKFFTDSSLYRLGDRFAGELYGYQADGDAYLMFYNKPWLDDERNQLAFEKIHKRQLRIPETWDELDLQLRFFHQPEKGRYGGSLFRNANYVIWELWARLHAKGLYPFDDDMHPRLNTSAGELHPQKLVRRIYCRVL